MPGPRRFALPLEVYSVPRVRRAAQRVWTGSPSGSNCSSLAEVVARSVDMSEVRIISHILQSAPALTALGQRSRSVCPPQQLHPVLICRHGSGSLDSLYVVLRT